MDAIIGLDTIQLLVVYMLICMLLYVIKLRFFSCKTRFWISAVFVFYLMGVIDYTIFPIFIMQGRNLGMDYDIHSFTQLIPGKTIIEYLQSGNLYQIFGNIILFMPFVLFMFIFLQKKRPIPIIFLGALASILIELTQLIIDLVTNYPNRVFDVDDFILNTVGVILATVVFNYIKRIKGIQKIYCKYIKNYHQDD